MTVVDYLRRRGAQWHREGPRLVTNCPLHDDAHPSFTVYPDGRWYCFSCQQGGDLPDLVAALEFPHLPRPFGPEEWRQIFDRAGKPPSRLPRPEPVGPTEEEVVAMSTAFDHYREVLADNLAARRYLRERGIHHPAELPVGYCTGEPRQFASLASKLDRTLGPGWPAIAERIGVLYQGRERARGRLFIAEVRSGRVLYYVLRAISPARCRYLNPPGHVRRRIMFTGSLSRPGPVYITEGVFDALPVIERGGAALALLGSHVSEPELLLSSLQGRVPVIASDWDGDDRHGGEMLARTLGEKIEAAGLRPLRLPPVPGCKDLGDWATRFPEQTPTDLWTFTTQGMQSATI